MGLTLCCSDTSLKKWDPSKNSLLYVENVDLNAVVVLHLGTWKSENRILFQLT